MPLRITKAKDSGQRKEMNLKRILSSLTIPEPPKSLRVDTLNAATVRLNKIESVRRSGVSAEWRFLWGISVAACLIFLFTWNPPFPDSQPSLVNESNSLQDRELFHYSGVFEHRMNTAELKEYSLEKILKEESL
jgi:hypothetical protein